MNRIDRKHVDFLVCEPGSMRPTPGVELDDASHEGADRQERDLFVDQDFAAAELPLTVDQKMRCFLLGLFEIHTVSKENRP